MTGPCILTAAITATMIAQQQPTKMLLIVRERIHPGAEVAYDSVETELAACAPVQDAPILTSRWKRRVAPGRDGGDLRGRAARQIAAGWAGRSPERR